MGDEKIRLLGSTLALVLGTLYVLSGLAQIANEAEDVAQFVGGPAMILGALAYRSRKRRIEGLKPDTMIRKVLESTALVVIVLSVCLQRDLMVLIATDPVPNFIVPAWALIAYFFAGCRIKTAVAWARRFSSRD